MQCLKARVRCGLVVRVWLDAITRMIKDCNNSCLRFTDKRRNQCVSRCGLVNNAMAGSQDVVSLAGIWFNRLAPIPSPPLWIPAFAGMTVGLPLDSRVRGNDGSFRGKDGIRYGLRTM